MMKVFLICFGFFSFSKLVRGNFFFLFPNELTYHSFKLADTLMMQKDSVIYDYPSTDGSTRVVVTFTSVTGKDYKDIIPKDTTDQIKPFPVVFDVIVSQHSVSRTYQQCCLLLFSLLNDKLIMGVRRTNNCFQNTS